MKLHLAAALLAFCFLCTGAKPANSVSSARSAQAPQATAVPGFTVRRTAAEVHLLVSVTDRFDRPVRGLTASNFRVFDGDEPVLAFTGFREDHDVSLHLGVLIDLSDSVERQIDLETRAACEFLKRILRPQGDYGFIMGFARAVSSPAAYSPDISASGFSAGKAPRGIGTALYDAIIEAAEHSHSVGAHSARRVIVVLSDGEDTLSMHTEQAAIVVAQRHGVVIYTVALHAGRHGRDGGEAVLRHLSSETGGLAFTAEEVDALTAVFKRVEQELTSQYSVTYKAPVPQGRSTRYRRVRVVVDIKGHKHNRVHARAGYFLRPE